MGIIPFVIVAVCVGFLNGCNKSAQAPTDNVERDCMYQVSTLQALVAGHFYGVTDVADILAHGDIGVGTFEGAEGEMIVLDGVCYKALADGTVQVMGEETPVPFAVSTWFEADDTKTFKGNYDMETLKAALDSITLKQGANTFYVAKIKGKFPEMKVRAVTKQQEPYAELVEVMKTSQVMFDYEDVVGTLVAVYCPPYVAGVNAVGWHIHFLSDDKSKGGHVLDLSMTDGAMEIDRTDAFHMELPNDDKFNALDLTGRDKEIGKVEQGSAS